MKYKSTGTNKKVDTVYPSAFGSHASMLSTEHESFNEQCFVGVICKDERGFYLTERKNLDNGLCDRDRIIPTVERTKRMEDAYAGE